MISPLKSPIHPASYLRKRALYIRQEPYICALEHARCCNATRVSQSNYGNYQCPSKHTKNWSKSIYIMYMQYMYTYEYRWSTNQWRFCMYLYVVLPWHKYKCLIFWSSVFICMYEYRSEFICMCKYRLSKRQVWSVLCSVSMHHHT